MSVSVTKDELIDVLRLRYDPYSAEAVFELARQRAELPVKTDLDGKELAAFRAALAVVGDRVQLPLSRIDEMLGSKQEAAPAKNKEAAPKETPKETPKAQPAKAAAPKETARESATSKEASNEAAEQIATTIVLIGVDAEDGEQILVCGGLSALGDWDPERAQPMARKGDEWLLTVEVAPDADIAFKFLRKTPDGTLLWEKGDDRRLGGKPRVEATWRE